MILLAWLTLMVNIRFTKISMTGWLNENRKCYISIIFEMRILV